MQSGNRERPTSRISQAYPDRVEVRGRDLTGDLMGRLSFTEYFHLLLTGQEPNEEQRYFLDLLLVVIAIIVADLAFAVDSIPAAFAVTRDPLVIWTANAFALLGLGSLLALVDILVRRFRYVGKTIAVILAFVGIKILTADLVHISDLGSLVVIALLLAGGVVASLAADHLDPPHPVEEATRRPPRCPRELKPPTGSA